MNSTEGWQPNRRNNAEIIFHYYRKGEPKSLCKRATRRQSPTQEKPAQGFECANCAQRLYLV